MRHPLLASLVVSLVISVPTFATEPNETFATATMLPPGVLSVADELTLANFPDTILGIRDQFGFIYHVNDDGGPYASTYGSGVAGMPTNSGSIDFSVTGFPDENFVGSHSESGYYEVFVDVYDFFDDLVDSFSEVRLLQPDVVHDFSFSDFEWIGGSYDVYTDNTIGASDMDFFTFTGLTPGAAFTARTLDPEMTEIDTYLGWFDDGGTLSQADDDTGGGPFGLLSLIAGIVPSSGMLTFAVTGYPDENFVGDHAESGTYELLLEVEDADLPGDFNGDGAVDAADYVVWRKRNGTEEEYNTWRANFGQPAGSGSAAMVVSFGKTLASVPEPAGPLMLTGWAAAGLLRLKRRSG